jgi:hypothetical protein
MDNTEDVECIRKGRYLVIKDTNVVVHDTEDRILGLLVTVEDELMVVVPEKPTHDMVHAYEAYHYELPTLIDKDEIVSEIQAITDDVQRVVSELEGLKTRLAMLYKKL